MCDCQTRTVLLHVGGRSFRCAYCARVQEHPHADIYFALDGHVYGGECGRWMKIENDIRAKLEVESAADSESERCGWMR
jgi:hypothetical protein